MRDDGKPERIQRRRVKGWRMPPGAEYVGRPTFWGNPYHITQAPPMWDPAFARKMGLPPKWGRKAAVECFELMLASGWRMHRPPGFQIVERAMLELAGKDLACWCRLDQPCHADVLLKYANATVTLSGDVLPF